MKKTVFLFLGIGFLVYIQSLFNGFVIDDLTQVVNNNVLYGFDKIPSIFVYFWGSYYKPLFYVTLNIILTIFGNNPFPFHLAQLIFHIANTVLIFLLFSRFFKKNVSFILALIFLVHPAISEAVLYISAFQDVLYSFFGLIALNILVRFEKPKYTALVFFFLILSLLSKETGIAFFGIAVVYKFLFDRTNFVRYLIYSSLIVGVYVFIRIGILNINPFNSAFKPIWTYDSDIYTRLISIPKIIYKYLTLFVWPDKLQVIQLWWVRKVNFQDFYLPLTAITVFFSLVSLYGIRKYLLLKKESFPYLFFLAFLVIGLLLHIQIIALDATFAERWFYLPLIALLGLVGFILNRIKFNSGTKKIFYVLAILIIMLLSTRTFIRSFDWLGHKSLAVHDFEVDKLNPGTYFLLADYYMGNKQYADAYKLYTKVGEIAPKNEIVDSPLAFIELFRGNEKKAEEILRNSPKTILPNLLNYAYILLKSDPKAGKVLLVNSLKKFPDSYEINILLGLTEYNLGNKEEAVKYIKKAITLNRSKTAEYNMLLNSIDKNIPINI